MRKIYTLSFLLAALFCYSSCSKKSNSGSNACQLTGVYYTNTGYNYTNTDTFLLTYNSDGKLATLSNTDGGVPWTKHYEYSGNLVKVTMTGFSNQVDTLFLNNAGQLTSISQPVGSSTDQHIFLYGNDGKLLESGLRHYYYGPYFTSSYQSLNGDIITQLDSFPPRPGYDDSVHYEYFPDKAYAEEDYLAWQQLWNYDIAYMKNAHLVKSIKHGINGMQTLINYTFDATGKITGYTTSGNSFPEQAVFIYSCN